MVFGQARARFERCSFRLCSRAAVFTLTAATEVQNCTFVKCAIALAAAACGSVTVDTADVSGFDNHALLLLDGSSFKGANISAAGCGQHAALIAHSGTFAELTDSTLQGCRGSIVRIQTGARCALSRCALSESRAAKAAG